MLVADLEPGDLLYFPSFWLHEVHNLTPDSKAITNAVLWPSENKNQEEEKSEKIVPAKRPFAEVLHEYKEYKDLTLG